MKRLLCSLIFLLAATSMQAISMTPVSELLEKSKDPSNLDLASVALIRCAALLDLSQIVIKSEIDQKALVDPSNLLAGAVNIRLNLDNKNATKEIYSANVAKYSKDVMEEVRNYFSLYQKWFVRAQKESVSDDYFDDRELKTEFIQCNEVYDSFMRGKQLK